MLFCSDTITFLHINLGDVNIKECFILSTSYYTCTCGFWPGLGLPSLWPWYWNFNPFNAFTEKNEEKCESQLTKHINVLQRKPVETKIYFQLNMIVSFKFKRNIERHLILIVRNGLIENFEIR